VPLGDGNGEMANGSIVYRTNTFPLIHAGFVHALLNIISLTPLLERFEAEHGTLTTTALFLGRKCLLGVFLIGKQANYAACSSIDYTGVIVYFCGKGNSTYEYGCGGS